MIIKEIEYSPFTLRMKAPFQNSSQIFRERKGFIIRAEDELGNISYGECSPLPGFSLESITEAGNDIKRLSRTKLELSKELDLLEEEIQQLGLSNSVRFALEQIALNLLAVRDTNFLKYNFVDTKSEIDINASFGFGEPEEILQAVSKKLNAGYKTIKLKVGRDNTYEDHQLLEEARKRFGNQFKLRIDANCKWSSDEAIEYLDRFRQFSVEYIEEPCEYCCSTVKAIDFSLVPIALDESLDSLENARMFLNECKAQFFVVKPMVLGSVISVYKFMKEAEALNKNVIISSSFESSVGKSALVFLASLTKHSYAHGLDTQNYFENNLCPDSYPVTNGKIYFDLNSFPPKQNIQLP